MKDVAVRAVQEYVESARWFGGKGRTFTVSATRKAGVLGDPGDLAGRGHRAGDPRVRRPGAAGARDLPGAARLLRHRRRSASSTRWSARGRTRTSARCSPTTPCTTARPRRCGCGPSTRRSRIGDLTFHRLPGHDLDLDTHSTLFSGEQSNSSLAFGEDSLMKMFRKVTTGQNPDIVIHEALTKRGSDARRRALRLARARGGCAASRCSSRCCSSSCAPPATAGSWRWPACATCSPRPTCTPTRSAATSRPRRPARRGHRAGARRARRGVPDRDLGRARAGRPRRRDADPARGRPGDRARARRARRRAARDVPRRRHPRLVRPVRQGRSGCTGTSTSGRRCAPSRAGRSSTSRASRPSRWPSGSARTSSGATSPGCCGPSTTPRTPSRPTSRWRPRSATRSRFRAAEWADRNTHGVPRAATSRPAAVRRTGSRPSRTLILRAYTPTRPSTRRSTRHATGRPGCPSPSAAIARITRPDSPAIPAPQEAKDA